MCLPDTVDRSPASPALRPFSIERRPAFAKVYVCFSRIKKMLGRIETRPRDRIYCQTIRTVRDISRDDRARFATGRLRTLTDRLKDNYSIDYSPEIVTFETHHQSVVISNVLDVLPARLVRPIRHRSYNMLPTLSIIFANGR